MRTGYIQDCLGLEDILVSGSFMQTLLGYFQPKAESTHLFPNMFIFTIPSLSCWLSLSFIPASERAASVQYDLYGAVNMKDETAQAALATIEGKVKNTISKLETEYQLCLDSTGCVKIPLNQKYTNFHSYPTSILPGLDLEFSGMPTSLHSLLVRFV